MNSFSLFRLDTNEGFYLIGSASKDCIKGARSKEIMDKTGATFDQLKLIGYELIGDTSDAKFEYMLHEINETNKFELLNYNIRTKKSCIIVVHNTVTGQYHIDSTSDPIARLGNYYAAGSIKSMPVNNTDCTVELFGPYSKSDNFIAQHLLQTFMQYLPDADYTKLAMPNTFLNMVEGKTDIIVPDDYLMKYAKVKHENKPYVNSRNRSLHAYFNTSTKHHFLAYKLPKDGLTSITQTDPNDEKGTCKVYCVVDTKDTSNKFFIGSTTGTIHDALLKLINKSPFSKELVSRPSDFYAKVILDKIDPKFRYSEERRVLQEYFNKYGENQMYNEKVPDVILNSTQKSTHHKRSASHSYTYKVQYNGLDYVGLDALYKEISKTYGISSSKFARFIKNGICNQNDPDIGILRLLESSITSIVKMKGDVIVEVLK